MSIFEYDAKRHIEMEKEESYEEGHSRGVTEGHSRGLTEGHSLGLTEGHVSLIRKNLKKNMDVTLIADFLEEDVTYVESIAELLSQYPEASDLEIVHLFQKGEPVF